MKTAPKRSATVDPEARHWAGKLGAATTPAQVAAVEWDRARAVVKDLPEQAQAQAWRELSAAVQTVRQKLTRTGDGP